MILMIDNYDSFTYNLVQYLRELGQEILVHRNDQITVSEIRQLSPEAIVVSPGPCTPNEAGVSLETVATLQGQIPILGVCLGHQSIGQSFGGEIIRARQVMHGKLSSIYHNGEGLFGTLPNPFTATRYHSLIIDKSSLPDCLEITAWTEQNGEFDEIMGIRHRTKNIHGVQFHPESILTEYGHELLDNFIKQASNG
ncbi:MAG: anthranilate/aminodeoxychorismate synthase component II [Gammaproteobacteria bacterium]|nr:anthranilate/aminodeoxychorismate synthase component II [Gammaproteobacteria bacterium]MAW27963.1 anthranilate/aminodeoxychorismate synthase component II [Gammaproteobacteria bacterium]OUU10588.1 MAG: anthranilate/aminodeoxychorismate synthase component II [Gammaproteobacteria bacterium TMED34]OUU10895.1 MAG: anthranilate/aminodeoxychorismate synthase component II [Gammaproteobacteria bacterium TMED34]|tara:strand:+ start:60 stop:647 length:588 start_codon:yes stop_codon:yes gene_type:complete